MGANFHARKSPARTENSKRLGVVLLPVAASLVLMLLFVVVQRKGQLGPSSFLVAAKGQDIVKARQARLLQRETLGLVPGRQGSLSGGAISRVGSVAAGAPTYLIGVGCQVFLPLRHLMICWSSWLAGGRLVCAIARSAAFVHHHQPNQATCHLTVSVLYSTPCRNVEQAHCTTICLESPGPNQASRKVRVTT